MILYKTFIRSTGKSNEYIQEIMLEKGSTCIDEWWEYNNFFYM